MLHKGTTWRRKWSRMASSPRTSSFQCCNMAKSVGRFVTLFHQPERRIAESEAVTCRLLRSFILKLARLGVNMIKQAIWWWLALRAKILSQKALGLGTCLEQKTIEASLYKHNRLSFCYRMLVVAFCFQEPDSWFGHAKNLHWNHWRHSLFFSGVKLIWELGVDMSTDHFGTSKSIRTSLDSLPIWNLRWQVQHSLVGSYPWPCLHTALGTRSSWCEIAATTKPLGGPWMDGRLER